MLFEIGKFLIGLYIGKQGLESTYGAAASIVVVLIWVYFSAQIVLYGAEITNVQAKSARQESRRRRACITEIRHTRQTLSTHGRVSRSPTPRTSRAADVSLFHCCFRRE